IGSGGGQQLQAGSAADHISLIQVIDTETNRTTSEITINEGSRVRPGIRMIDSAGRVRTDIDVSYSSINPEIAAPDGSGNLIGKQAGFSTITIAAGGAVATATATVVRVDSSAGGFDVV